MGFGGFSFNPVQQLSQVASGIRDVGKEAVSTAESLGSNLSTTVKDIGSGVSGMGHSITGGEFGNFASRVPEGIGQDISGGWGGIGTMLGSFFGQNEDMAGLRVLWGPLLAYLGGAAGVGEVAVEGAGAGEGIGGGAGTAATMPAAITDSYATVGGGSAATGGITAMPAAGADPYAVAGGGSAAVGGTSAMPPAQTLPTESTAGILPQDGGMDFAGSAPGSNEAVNAAFGNGSGSAVGGGFSMGLPSLLSAYNMGTGLYGLYNAEEARRAAKQPQVYDPFGPQRAQYQQQLAELTADPSKIQSDPGYTSGLQAVQRTMAAQGYLGSGNMMNEIANFGGNFYNQAVSRLSGLAGANIGPVQQNSSSRVAANDMMSRSLASIGFSLAQMAA